jgi:hypothetical protein
VVYRLRNIDLNAHWLKWQAGCILEGRLGNRPVGMNYERRRKMKTNELSEKDFESISEEDLETVSGGLRLAVTLPALEAMVCISQL